MEFSPKMKLICPNCKFELILWSPRFYVCGADTYKCNLNVGFSLDTFNIIVRNFNDSIELILNNCKMPKTNLDIIISENKISIDYKPSENIQEVLFDLFKILLKHEGNLVFS